MSTIIYIQKLDPVLTLLKSSLTDVLEKMSNIHFPRPLTAGVAHQVTTLHHPYCSFKNRSWFGERGVLTQEGRAELALFYAWGQMCKD